jgi:hypothetical protein
LMDHLKALHRQVLDLETQIEAWHRENEASRKLEAIPGIGPITPEFDSSNQKNPYIPNEINRLAALFEILVVARFKLYILFFMVIACDKVAACLSR